MTTVLHPHYIEGDSGIQEGKMMHQRVPRPLALRARCPHAHGRLQWPLTLQEDEPRFPEITEGPCTTTEFDASQLEVGADYLLNPTGDQSQLWVLLSYLNCTQSGPAWLTLDAAGAEPRGCGPLCPATASQRHLHSSLDKLPEQVPSHSHNFFLRKYHIPWILRCPFLFYISMFLKWRKKISSSMWTLNVVVILLFPLEN